MGRGLGWELRGGAGAGEVSRRGWADIIVELPMLLLTSE